VRQIEIKLVGLDEAENRVHIAARALSSCQCRTLAPLKLLAQLGAAEAPCVGRDMLHDGAVCDPG
jgi:hypothetical protein